MLVNETKNRAGVTNQPSGQQTSPSNDIAISVRNLTKRYRIFGHPGDRIKQAQLFSLLPHPNPVARPGFFMVSGGMERAHRIHDTDRTGVRADAAVV